VIVNILIDQVSGKRKVWESHNLITTAGLKWIVEKMAGETPTNAFVNLVLGTGSTAAAADDDYSDVTPISGANKAPSSGYPQTDDQDADNTGAGVNTITWRYEYATTDFNNSAVREGCITIAAPSGSCALFNRWVEASSYEKSASAILIQFVNVTPSTS